MLSISMDGGKSRSSTIGFQFLYMKGSTENIPISILLQIYKQIIVEASKLNIWHLIILPQINIVSQIYNASLYPKMLHF